MNRRGQSWSVDVVLAVVIFGFISIAFTSFALLDDTDVEQLQTGAQRVELEFQAPIKNCGTVLENDTINNDSIECLYNESYDEIKRELRLKGDVCVYIEDENGQVIPFNGKNGWGNSELEVAGQPCGT